MKAQDGIIPSEALPPSNGLESKPYSLCKSDNEDFAEFIVPDTLEGGVPDTSEGGGMELLPGNRRKLTCRASTCFTF